MEVSLVRTIPSRREIRLSCPSTVASGILINERVIRWQCRRKRCKDAATKETGIANPRVFHEWDFYTGQLLRTIVEESVDCTQDLVE